MNHVSADIQESLPFSKRDPLYLAGKQELYFIFFHEFYTLLVSILIPDLIKIVCFSSKIHHVAI